MVVRQEGSPGLLRANRSFRERVGIEDHELALRPLLDWIHPDDRAGLEELMRLAEGETTARHATRTGEWLPFHWQVREHHGGLALLGVFQRGPSPSAPEASGRGSLPGATMDETLHSMARIVEAKNPGLRCSILLADAECKVIVGGAGPSFPDAYNKAVEGLLIGPTVGSCGTAAFWGIPVVVENIEQDVLWRDLHGAAAIADVAACWSHPVTSTSGEVLGAMALYSSVPLAPTKHQMDGLEIAARMVGQAIERDRLEEQLRQAVKVEAIGILAGGIAHDFNNLLASVLGNAELALARLPAGDGVTPMLHEIVTASVSASGLCDQLLAYAGKSALSSETIEVNGFVRELVGLLQVTMSNKAKVTFELSEQALHVVADRSQLRQVLMNLIKNAGEALGDTEGRIVLGSEGRDFTAEELEQLHPEAGLRPGEYLRLWVSDTGIGMDPATQARIFDPFFTTKATGRGLGLAAVQGIVRGHRGAIRIESGPRIGTTFTVLLPLTRVTPGIEDVDSDLLTFDGDGRRLLVVDDEPAVRRLLASMLGGVGYEVQLAADGIEALELLGRTPGSFDCVLLDLCMPRLSGEEVFRSLREFDAGVPVVLISGFPEQEVLDRFAGQGSGLASILQKPVPMQDLLEAVGRALGTVRG